jgi:lipoprotein-anchoring transpeptidase ErfK/SrfK
MYGSFNRAYTPDVCDKPPEGDRFLKADPHKPCNCKAGDPPYKILVNTKEKRLYLYQSGKLLESYHIAIGKPSTPTPKGTFKIINKDPTPHLPTIGAAWMGISKPHYGIHGTNDPESIGKAVSDGCVRMYNRDLLELYYKLPLGTEVEII